jgi:signal transduction histidine kinase
MRLATLLSLAVVVVLLVTGLAVNRFVSRSLEEELTAGQQERIALVALAIGELDLSAPRAQRGLQAILRGVASAVGGRAELLGADGRVLASAGPALSAVETQRVEEPVAGEMTLVIRVPQPEHAFLRVFNATLLVAGLVVVLALFAAAALLSERLTRPLRGVAAAAQRLGSGDLAARASGGPDRESAELAEAFNAMGARLERSEMLRRRAASDMAHDLATPATVLESQLQAMLDGVVPTDRQQLDRARAAAGALSGVIGQMRELVDAESAALSRRAARVEIARLLDDLQKGLEPLFRERGVTLAVAPAPGGLAVEVDPEQVGRALRNVLVNAAQHAPIGSSVRLSVTAAAGEAILRAADSGPGIAAADLPHVFERFYRADEGRGPGPARSGSGIGLTIARELLAANRGRIWVDDSGPGGTTFAVALPLAGSPGSGSAGSGSAG